MALVVKVKTVHSVGFELFGNVGVDAKIFIKVKHIYTELFCRLLNERSDDITGTPHDTASTIALQHPSANVGKTKTSAALR